MLRRPVIAYRLVLSRGTTWGFRSIRSPSDGITVVEDWRTACEIVNLLQTAKNKWHAIDTETANLDVRQESPWVAGSLLCFSIYLGPKVDFGTGPLLWVDATVPRVLRAFQKYFADPQIQKVFHNYSFDRAVLCHAMCQELHDSNVNAIQGFCADTMHMARLLSNGMNHRYNLADLSKELLPQEFHKKSLKETFGQFAQRRDNTPSKRLVLPAMDELQATRREEWQRYATHDAFVTWHLFQKLRSGLLGEPWQMQGQESTMWDFYEQWYRPFAEVLSDVEELGIRVDTQGLEQQLARSKDDAFQQERKFRDWVFNAYVKLWGEDEAKGSRIWHMNLNSDVQKRHLLFAPILQKRINATGPLKELEEQKTFPSPSRDPVEDEELQEQIQQRIKELEMELAALGKKKTSKKGSQNHDEDALRLAKRKQLQRLSFQLNSLQNPKRLRDVTITGLALPPGPIWTKSGFPSASSEALKKLCKALRAHPEKLKKHRLFESREDIEEACQAIEALIQANYIKKSRDAFLGPLLKKGQNGRIHPQLNVNTDTGRLSCRAPNFQALPSGEKDEYGVRASIIGEAGNCILAADYSQLELRVLAHITNCQSLITAFQQGNDIHSETAYELYPEIAAAYKMDRAAALPAIKTKFATERMKAKTLNFGILYGQSAASLAKEWGTSKVDAQKLVDRWFAGRPEVKQWKEDTLRQARKSQKVFTFTGRVRTLQEIESKDNARRSHSERVAINTPVQGSAADIVMAAMIGLHHSDALKELGYKVIMQIHDELLIEGPKENAEEAMELMKSIMEHPPGLPELRVPLIADAKQWHKP